MTALALPAAAVSLLLLVPVPAVSQAVDSDHAPDASHRRPDAFSVCYGHGCRETVQLSLTAREWAEVKKQLSPPADNALNERRRIRRAIALLEVIVGRHTGTSSDIGGTFAGTGRLGQMDCVDEATNTTAYLQRMANAGLLRWHTVDEPAHRGFFILGWPHTSAVIRETETGERYSVDSWFHANGYPPEIVPLNRWRAGWRPEK